MIEIFDPEHSYPVPAFQGGCEAWNHQQYGVHVALSPVRNHYGAWWGMGSGKSRFAVDVVQNMPIKHRRVLIICPHSVVPHWEHQHQKYEDLEGHDIRFVQLHKMKMKDAAVAIKDIDKANQADGAITVFVLNYERAWQGDLGQRILAMEWDYCILDEAHKIKTYNSKVSKWAEKLHYRCERRLALTGTPFANSPLDIFGIGRFLDPSVFGKSWYEFRARYALTWTPPGSRAVIVKSYINLDELRYKAGLLGSFLRTEDLIELPPTSHITVPVELEPSAKRIYDKLERDLVAEIKEGEGVISAANALVSILRLQQCTGGAVKVEDVKTGEETVETISTAKRNALRDLFGSEDSENPIIVFCRFTADIKAVQKAAEQAGRECMELSGKKNQLKEWQDAKSGEVIAVQIQAGGTGVELTRAAVCVYYSIGHSLADYQQSLARCHRPGQDRKVRYYHMTCFGTVDEKIDRALKNKEDIVASVIESTGGRVTGKAKEEVPQMFQKFTKPAESSGGGISMKGRQLKDGRKAYRL